MSHLFQVPIDQILATWWGRVEDSQKRAFAFTALISVLAFGFEMTNLTLNHDDVYQIVYDRPTLQLDLGRFGFAWLHYYGQNSYIMPFLQMTEAILVMCAYGLVVARFWGLRNTMDVALVSAILCIFPYMAEVYQYNTSMATYPIAHLLAALAVIISVRGGARYVVGAALLYTGAFSIYQSVLANAATIFVVWLLLGALLTGEARPPIFGRAAIRATVAALTSVAIGGAVYLACVRLTGIQPDTYQGADQALGLGDALDLRDALPAIWRGSRAFFFWPEYYFPDYLKKLQLALLLGAAGCCVLIPAGARRKVVAVVLLGMACVAPRTLEVLHPGGNYHNLTLTGYAVVIAGAVAILVRYGRVAARNVSVVFALALLVAYVMQSNWISTVNYLNTFAHFEAMTQVLSRLRSIPDASWDGRSIVVVGRYAMPHDYPFQKAIGIASDFLDAKHMQRLSRLMRDDAHFINASSETPKALEFAATHPVWPSPSSVGIVDGAGVVVLSKNVVHDAP